MTIADIANLTLIMKRDISDAFLVGDTDAVFGTVNNVSELILVRRGVKD